MIYFLLSFQYLDSFKYLDYITYSLRSFAPSNCLIMSLWGKKISSHCIAHFLIKNGL